MSISKKPVSFSLFTLTSSSANASSVSSIVVDVPYFIQSLVTLTLIDL